MSTTWQFSRLYRGAERRLPLSADIGLRLATQLGLAEGAKVADLGSANGQLALLLAKEHAAQVTCVDPDPSALAELAGAAKDEGLEARITGVCAEPSQAELPKESFQAVVAESSRLVAGSVKEAAEKVRSLLAPDGRAVLVVRARVGLQLPEAVAGFYQQRSEPLHFPRELLHELEQGGFEPLHAEAVPDQVMDDYWGFVEQELPKADGDIDVDRLQREMDLFRREGARSCVNTLVLLGRRKEPGERPPPARGEE